MKRQVSPPDRTTCTHEGANLGSEGYSEQRAEEGIKEREKREKRGTSEAIIANIPAYISLSPDTEKLSFPFSSSILCFNAFTCEKDGFISSSLQYTTLYICFSSTPQPKHLFPLALHVAQHKLVQTKRTPNCSCTKTKAYFNTAHFK